MAYEQALRGTHHVPQRGRGPYTAEVGGSSWAGGPIAEFSTIRECRKFAESYGTTADWCVIEDRRGRKVAEHRRDSSGDGTRWFRATI
jgi:hypothetical protein